VTKTFSKINGASQGDAGHSPLRVAIVAASLRILGGQSVQANRMLEGWRRHPDVEAWLVPIDPLPPPGFRWLRRIKYVRTIATEVCYWPLLVRKLWRADVVHVFSASYTSFLLSPLPAVLIARCLRRPVVLNYHSGEAADHLRRSRLARVILSRWVTRNVVPSAYLRDALAAFGITAEVIPNSVDLDRFAYRERRRRHAPQLLSTRNLEPLYNVSCTLRAFARVQRRHPEARLVLVGAGSEERTLKALADELGLRHVVFAGRVESSDVHRYYADADVYVQTPSIDNMPLSVLEAFASGLPVVSTRTGGVPAILTDGVHGLLVEQDNEVAVAKAVVQLIENPEHARTLAKAARQSCAAYEWSAVASQWLSIYRSVLPAPHAGMAACIVSDRVSPFL
jgi:glycosyltransferase involved in cell wall biosynthesis